MTLSARCVVSCVNCSRLNCYILRARSCFMKCSSITKSIRAPHQCLPVWFQVVAQKVMHVLQCCSRPIKYSLAPTVMVVLSEHRAGIQLCLPASACSSVRVDEARAARTSPLAYCLANAAVQNLLLPLQMALCSTLGSWGLLLWLRLLAAGGGKRPWDELGRHLLLLSMSDRAKLEHESALFDMLVVCTLHQN